MVKVFTIIETVREYIGSNVNEFFLSEEGATAIEYALMAALIGGTVIVSQAALGQAVATMYSNAIGIITAAMGS